MRWSVKSNWRLWFAWHPVMLDADTKVWWEFVERRHREDATWGAIDEPYEYRLRPDR